jgi:hypothetical protein
MTHENDISSRRRHYVSSLALLTLPALWISGNIALAILNLPHGLGLSPIPLAHTVLGYSTMVSMVLLTLAASFQCRWPENILPPLSAIKIAFFINLLVHATVWAFVDIQLLFLMVIEVLRFQHLVMGGMAFLFSIVYLSTSSAWSKKYLWAPLQRILQFSLYPALCGGFLHSHMTDSMTHTDIALIGIFAVTIILMTHLCCYRDRQSDKEKISLMR